MNNKEQHLYDNVCMHDIYSISKNHSLPKIKKKESRIIINNNNHHQTREQHHH